MKVQMGRLSNFSVKILKMGLNHLQGNRYSSAAFVVGMNVVIAKIAIKTIRLTVSLCMKQPVLKKLSEENTFFQCAILSSGIIAYAGLNYGLARLTRLSLHPLVWTALSITTAVGYLTIWMMMPVPKKTNK